MVGGLEHVDLVAIVCCEIEVVQGDHSGEAEACRQRQNVELVSDVEVVGRFVHDEKVRILGERSGHENALALAARQKR